MATTATVLRADDVPPEQLSALKRKARRMGVTLATYIKQLIENDLALDRKAKNSSLDDLAAPHREAMKDISESELDRLVDDARTKHAARKRRRR